ncbi:uncharacterized protein BP01DRAFT_265815, partial [Aspergillus saccharolyticus JOP 1030-1]
WRQLLRSLLREASYLPDPIAKIHMHHHILHRFRHYADNSKFRKRNDLWQHWQLRKKATKGLSVLQRANEGYLKPLEKVLRMAYGRTGSRRMQLVRDLIVQATPSAEPIPTSLQDLLERKCMTEDWKPAKVVVDLLKAQAQNPMIQYLNAGPKINQFEPNIPKENAWSRPVPQCRRRNIRKRWYGKMLSNLLPPLPLNDLEVLEGLISGRLPWTPPKRRKAVRPTQALAAPASEAHLNVEFLVDGPKKSQTYRPYAVGRPHVFTRRFMVRVWMRLSTLVPRVSIHTEPGTEKLRHRFTWNRAIAIKMASPVSKETAADIFGGIDSQGKLL